MKQPFDPCFLIHSRKDAPISKLDCINILKLSYSSVCVLRGKVISPSMEALIGVRVSRENHLEEGFTLTRYDFT